MKFGTTVNEVENRKAADKIDERKSFQAIKINF